MHQITYPITAKLMSDNKQEELNDLYKKSSITLQVIGGLILIGILVNINELYIVLAIIMNPNECLEPSNCLEFINYLETRLFAYLRV